MRTSLGVLIFFFVFAMGLGPYSSGPEDSSSEMTFFVGDSRTQRMLSGVKLLLLSENAPISEIGVTDVNGRVVAELGLLRAKQASAVLFCRTGYFCGAFRLDEAGFFEYREHFVQLAPFAMR